MHLWARSESRRPLSPAGVSRECNPQKIDTFSIGRKNGSEGDSDGSHARGSESPNCMEEGCGSGNRSNYPNPNQAIVPLVEIRNQVGLKLQSSLEAKEVEVGNTCKMPP